MCQHQLSSRLKETNKKKNRSSYISPIWGVLTAGQISLKFCLTEIADVIIAPNFMMKHWGSIMWQEIEIWHFPPTFAIAIITSHTTTVRECCSKQSPKQFCSVHWIHCLHRKEPIKQLKTDKSICLNKYISENKRIKTQKDTPMFPRVDGRSSWSMFTESEMAATGGNAVWNMLFSLSGHTNTSATCYAITALWKYTVTCIPLV